MEDMTDVYIIERLEQLRVLADPLRVRILEQLVHRPMTMSQLGEQFGESTNKMHYHVHELERFGFIKLVEKRERGGFLEKYFRAVAKDFTLAPNLLLTSPNSEAISAIREVFEQIVQGAAQSLSRRAEHADTSETVSLTSETLWLTEEEFREVERQINALMAPFLEPRQNTGVQAWHAHFIAYTLAPPGEEQKPGPYNVMR